MSVYLNQFPQKQYRTVVHVDAERHCLEVVSSVAIHEGMPAMLAAIGSVNGEFSVLVDRKDSLLEWRSEIESLLPILEARGIEPSEVLVVSDCYNYKRGDDGLGVPCGPPRSVYEKDWSPLMNSPLDFAIWDVDQCPSAHSSACHLLAVS